MNDMTAVLSPPPRHMLLLESRAAIDLARMVGPLLGAGFSKRPDQERPLVIVVPGFGSGDRYTLPLRHYLGRMKFDVEGWGLGKNLAGIDLPHTLEDLSDRWQFSYRSDYRGEASVPGVDRIHERVSAVLDDKPFEDQEHAAEKAPSRAIRPLAGIAIAASVALLAIFGLQQTSVETEESTAAPAIAETTQDTAYTAPDFVSDQLREYYLSHGATTTENGANGMNSRLVTLRLREEVLDGPTVDEKEAEERDAAEQDGTSADTQP